jgi:hypothetical protein
VLTFARQYIFLPLLVYCVAMLVTWRGSDSLSICFNTLAMCAGARRLNPTPQAVPIQLNSARIWCMLMLHLAKTYWRALTYSTAGSLFLLEIDNQCYSHGLSEQVRALVEQHGRLRLADAELRCVPGASGPAHLR